MATPIEMRAAALAAIFVKYEHEENTEGLQAIVDEINRDAEILTPLVRALAAFAVNFGERAFGEELVSRLQIMSTDLHGKAARGGD